MTEKSKSPGAGIRSRKRILSHLRGGQHLQLHYDPRRGPIWQLSGGRRVNTAAAEALIASRSIVASDDALFAGTHSQTYRLRHG